jgi:CBS domain-containing protein
MSTVRRILESKKKGFYTIPPDVTAYDALQIMADKDVGALLVVNEGNLIGIFTERDYSRKVILKGKSSKETAVHEIMTTMVFCVNPEHNIEHCMSLMNEKHVRHLPVLEDGKLIGLVSIRDVVNMVISEKENKIKELEGYIAGTNYEQDPSNR